MSAKKRSNPYLRAIVISVILFVFLFIIGLSAKSFVSSPIEASDGDSPVFGSVIFNEMLLSNDNFYPDGNGGFYDYIEFRNMTSSPIDISGWYVVENSNSSPWYFGYPSDLRTPQRESHGCNSHPSMCCSR